MHLSHQQVEVFHILFLLYLVLILVYFQLSFYFVVLSFVFLVICLCLMFSLHHVPLVMLFCLTYSVIVSELNTSLLLQSYNNFYRVLCILKDIRIIFSNASCCSLPHMNCLPFLVKSYIGFSSFCNSRQNILKKINHSCKTSVTFWCCWQLYIFKSMS